MLNCLGNQWFGKDVDRICSYNTPKIVKFRHRELGCISNTSKFLIILYIFVYTIWYKGKHFELFPIHGLNRMQFHQPTMNMCNPKLRNCRSNFTRPDKLSYCGSQTALQLPCMQYDGMGLPVPYRGGILLPTRVRKYSQERECVPDDENDPKKESDCPRIWKYLDSSGNEQTDTKPKPLEHNYVADIERFTLLIDHSFVVEEIGMGYDDYQMQGYWMDCEHTGKHRLKATNCKKRPIICMRTNCKPWMVTDENFKKQASTSFLASADDDEESEFADFVADDDDDNEIRDLKSYDEPASLAHGLHHNFEHAALDGQGRHHLLNSHHRKHSHHVIDEIRYPEVALLAGGPRIVDHDAMPFTSVQMGDVITIGNLLRMAGVDLDDKHFHKTFRWRGLVVVISVTYSNKQPWELWGTKSPPEYTIHVSRRPSYEFQYDQPVQESATNRRTYMSYHGILIVVEQMGEIADFSFIHLLVIVSGALSLLKLAAMLTDYAATHLVANKEEIKNLKYEESRDFYPDYD